MRVCQQLRWLETGLNLALAKHHRLLTSQDFTRVFDEADYKAGSRHLLILGCRSDTGLARLGLVVSKKHVNAAVDRNRLKRLGREVFRLRRAELPSVDLVIIARAGLGRLDNRQVLGLLNQQVDALIRQCNGPAAQAEPLDPSC